MEQKNIRKSAVTVLEYIIGISLSICLFLGGLGFIGFVVAFCIGGETATAICAWIYKEYYGFLIQLSCYTTLVCLLLLYIRGDAKWINPIRYWGDKIKGASHRKEITPEQVEQPAESTVSEEESAEQVEQPLESTTSEESTLQAEESAESTVSKDC